MYDFAKRNLRYVVERLDEDGDGWPEGSGNVERSGMGVEKLDNSVYLIRGLYDLADMARSKHDGRTHAWASNLARRAPQPLRGHLVDGGRPAARRLDRRLPRRRSEQPAAGPALDWRDADGGGATISGDAVPGPRPRATTATWP